MSFNDLFKLNISLVNKNVDLQKWSDKLKSNYIYNIIIKIVKISNEVSDKGKRGRNNSKGIRWEIHI
jgi:hypothetical protein